MMERDLGNAPKGLLDFPLSCPTGIYICIYSEPAPGTPNPDVPLYLKPACALMPTQISPNALVPNVYTEYSQDTKI